MPVPLFYIYVFFDVNLFLESALQIYYLAMAVYGWYQWRQPTDQSVTLPISTWSLKKHVVVIAVTGVIVVTSGYLLSKNTSAALPYVDAFTTWYAVVTTYMVTKKILENWGVLVCHRQRLSLSVLQPGALPDRFVVYRVSGYHRLWLSEMEKGVRSSKCPNRTVKKN